MACIDLVTIVHNDMNRSFAERLRVGLELYEPDNYRLLVRVNFSVNIIDGRLLSILRRYLSIKSSFSIPSLVSL